jgi:transposase
MVHLISSTPIMIAIKPVDFRKGIDGFVWMCQYELKQNPRSGTLFVFINRSGTMIRILVYEVNGYWLMTKRLSSGRFPNWPKNQSSITAIQASQLRKLLSGICDENRNN